LRSYENHNDNLTSVACLSDWQTFGKCDIGKLKLAKFSLLTTCAL
jgi:hypothetical protein